MPRRKGTSSGAKRPRRSGRRPKKPAAREAAPAVVSSRPQVSIAPPAPAAPSVRKPASVYHTMAVFAVGVIGIALVTFALVRELNPPSQAPVVQPTEAEMVFSELRKHPEFQSWIKAWQSLDPYLSVTEFALDYGGALRTATPPAGRETPLASDLKPPRSARYVMSPDGSRFVNYVAGYGQPENVVTLYNRKDEGFIETLARCGAPCRHDGAFWIDNERFVVFGNVTAAKKDGSRLCLDEPSGPANDREPPRCYESLFVTVYDLALDREWHFRSSAHFFGEDPFASRTRLKWLSGLSSEEKIGLQLVLDEEIETVVGTVIKTASDGGILTMRDANSAIRLVALLPQTLVIDDRGGAMEPSGLLPGFEIEVRGLPSSNVSLVAVSVRIARAPNVIVTAPGPEDEVGRSFRVEGLARTFENTVLLRVRHGRTDEPLLETFTTATGETGAFGPWSATLRLPRAAAEAGDRLLLEAYQVSADDGSEIDKTVIPLRYTP